MLTGTSLVLGAQWHADAIKSDANEQLVRRAHLVPAGLLDTARPFGDEAGTWVASRLVVAVGAGQHVALSLLPS